MNTGGPLEMNRPDAVAVVIPAKDEAERIEATIQAARRIAGVDLVVVVDDGSTDATAAIAMGADALVVRHKRNRGKAAAMATGAQMVAMREDAELADGGEGYREEDHAEERVDGHTGPLPVVHVGELQPRALLFLDADMQDSAVNAQPLVDAVLVDGVDMAIALLPPQEGAGGMGLVVRTARSGIRRATGWEPTQPLSGTRCITRETWDACQPLAGGWGVETSLTIDALDGGFWVKEIPCDLRHRATGNDMRGRMHRAAQLRDVLMALARRRHVTPDAPEEREVDPFAEGVETVEEQISPSEPAVPSDPDIETESDIETAPEVETEPDAESAPEIETEPHSESDSVPDEEPEPTPAPLQDEPAQEREPIARLDETERAEIAEGRRSRLASLPVSGRFSDDQLSALGDPDPEVLGEQLRALPVEGDFAPDDVVLLADADLPALAQLMRQAPVDGLFNPDQAVLLAAHAEVTDVRLPEGPVSTEEYVSAVIHAAVDAENQSDEPLP